MNNQPRQLTYENLYYNVWRLNTEVVPPDNLRVLCSDQNGTMWFDSYVDGEWIDEADSEGVIFAWQLPAKPMIF